MSKINVLQSLYAIDKSYRHWNCPICGHSVLSPRRPENIAWSDGHLCRDWSELKEVVVDGKLKEVTEIRVDGSVSRTYFK